MTDIYERLVKDVAAWTATVLKDSGQPTVDPKRLALRFYREATELCLAAGASPARS